MRITRSQSQPLSERSQQLNETLLSERSQQLNERLLNNGSSQTLGSRKSTSNTPLKSSNTPRNSSLSKSLLESFKNNVNSSDEEMDNALIDKSLYEDENNENTINNFQRHRNRLEKFLTDATGQDFDLKSANKKAREQIEESEKEPVTTPKKTKRIQKIGTVEKTRRKLAAEKSTRKVIQDVGSTDESDSHGPSDSETENIPISENRYFSNSKLKKSSTSNNTLEKLKKMDAESFHEALKEITWNHEEQIKILHKVQEQYFAQFDFELQQGYNLCLYGYGSKKKFLEKYIVYSGFDCIVIHGYFPHINISKILKSILVDHFGHQGPCGSNLDQVKLIAKYVKNSRLMLAIHSLDGAQLRGEKTQNILALLASIPEISMVCSVDHINSSLLWDSTKSAQFNFIWHDTTTFEPYLVETSFENRMLMMQNAKVKDGQGAFYVLGTLNENSRKLYLLLLEYQLENDTGLEFPLFYRMANEAFLTNTELAFKTQLTEFRDHDLISSKRGVDQVELLSIPFEKETMLDLLTKLS